MEGEEEKGVTADQPHKVEVHRDRGPRQAAKTIDNTHNDVSQLFNSHLQHKESGRLCGQGNPHEGNRDQQCGGEGEEEVSEEKNE